jgi:hypothetical protein
MYVTVHLLAPPKIYIPSSVRVRISKDRLGPSSKTNASTSVRGPSTRAVNSASHEWLTQQGCGRDANHTDSVCVMARKMGRLARHQTQKDWAHDYWLLAYATEQEIKAQCIRKRPLRSPWSAFWIPSSLCRSRATARILGQLCSVL